MVSETVYDSPEDHLTSCKLREVTESYKKIPGKNVFLVTTTIPFEGTCDIVVKYITNEADAKYLTELRDPSLNDDKMNTVISPDVVKVMTKQGPTYAVMLAQVKKSEKKKKRHSNPLYNNYLNILDELDSLKEFGEKINSTVKETGKEAYDYFKPKNIARAEKVINEHITNPLIKLLLSKVPNHKEYYKMNHGGAEPSRIHGNYHEGNSIDGVKIDIEESGEGCSHFDIAALLSTYETETPRPSLEEDPLLSNANILNYLQRFYDALETEGQYCIEKLAGFLTVASWYNIVYAGIYSEENPERVEEFVKRSEFFMQKYIDIFKVKENGEIPLKPFIEHVTVFRERYPDKDPNEYVLVYEILPDIRKNAMKQIEYVDEIKQIEYVDEIAVSDLESTLEREIA